MFIRNRGRFISRRVAVVSFSLVTSAVQAAPFIDQQQQHIQTQQSAKEAQLTPTAPDISLINNLPANVDAPLLPEKLCFQINKITLLGSEDFPSWFMPKYVVSDAVGHCIGVKGINQLMARLQNRLIEHGWVTSRVLVPPQELGRGELTLSLVAGKLGKVRYAQGSDQRAALYSSIPLKRVTC